MIERSAEYVGVGHIDRVCDLIAQKILTEALHKDKDSRVAVEVSCSKNILLIFGEITTKANLDYEALAKQVLKDCGYDKKYYNPAIIIDLNTQSENISERVHQEELCWGDQSTTIGHYEVAHTHGLPEPYYIARNIVTGIENLSAQDMVLWWNFTKDIKCLVEMDDVSVIKVTLSIQTHVKEKDYTKYYQLLKDKIVYMYEDEINFDKFEFNLDLYPRTSSLCDSGTTNRKIGVDMYGTSALMDGGGYNGKDYTKGDMAGKILAEEIAYKIAEEFNYRLYDIEDSERWYNYIETVDVIVNFNMGMTKPSSIIIKTDGELGCFSIEELEEIVGFEFTLQNVVDRYNLKERDYYNLAYNNLSYHTLSNVGNV